jgi:hypothetical protein
MTRTAIATACTYDDRELTSTGYDVEIYTDYAILVFHSNWQGSEPGTTYKAVPPAEVFAAAQREASGEHDDHEPDLHSAVTTWLQSAYKDEWKLLRTGNKIR